jgi:hypothetical protein
VSNNKFLIALLISLVETLSLAPCVRAKELLLEEIQNYVDRPIIQPESFIDSKPENSGRGNDAREYYFGHPSNSKPVGKNCWQHNWDNKKQLTIVNCIADNGTVCERVTYGGGLFSPSEITSSRCKTVDSSEYDGEFYENTGSFEVLLDSFISHFTLSSPYTKISVPDGRGVMKFPNGDIYDGEFMNGLMHGNGKYTSAKDNRVYNGEWWGGEKNGKGEITEEGTGMRTNGDWKYGAIVNGNGAKVEILGELVKTCETKIVNYTERVDGKCDYVSSSSEKAVKSSQVEWKNNFKEKIEHFSSDGFLVPVLRSRELLGENGEPESKTTWRIVYSKSYYKTIGKISRRMKLALCPRLFDRATGDRYEKCFGITPEGKIESVYVEDEIIKLKESGLRRAELYADEYDEKFVHKSVYFPDVGEKKKISIGGLQLGPLVVKYDRINKWLSGGTHEKLEGLEKKMGVQFDTMKLYSNIILGDGLLADPIKGFADASTSLLNLVVLANASSIDSLKKIRFQITNEGHPYGGIASLLDSLGINDDNLYKIEEKYIVAGLMSKGGDASTLSLVVNLEGIRDLLMEEKRKIGDFAIEHDGKIKLVDKFIDRKLFYAYDWSMILANDRAYRGLATRDEEPNDIGDKSYSLDEASFGRIGAHIVRESAYMIYRGHKTFKNWLPNSAFILAVVENEKENKDGLAESLFSNNAEVIKDIEEVLEKKTKGKTRRLVSDVINTTKVKMFVAKEENTSEGENNGYIREEDIIDLIFDRSMRKQDLK